MNGLTIGWNMVGLEVGGRDVTYAEVAPLKGGYGHQDVVSSAAGCWGDPFGKDVSTLLPMSPPQPNGPEG